jgi:hypothetical protein
MLSLSHAWKQSHAGCGPVLLVEGTGPLEVLGVVLEVVLDEDDELEAPAPPWPAPLGSPSTRTSPPHAASALAAARARP